MDLILEFDVNIKLKFANNTNLVSKYAINKLEYNFLLEDKNYLHSRSYGNNF